MVKKLLRANIALLFDVNVASATDLKSIGISVSSMGNPFFVALAKGASYEARKTNPDLQVTTVAYDYDLGKQFTEIDNFGNYQVEKADSDVRPLLSWIS